ncbi:hypothetical protein [Roseateles saccharophilus]|uniref:TonB family protein n=1 Tax=Roseateles saccharophilus TaxID=304 RepID=A0A4R3UQZ2_ROSSA|nr:hypothetical protein [Roseateles saccharophilus]MDG0833445.1 hypothetical protein [Roseateles saccharophilus]TCU93100.1 hypothetical protein EV671_102061 [Roseateles saccharophilus]
MSTRYSIARRTSMLNGLFASLACAVALTLTAGPALAQSTEMERVEVRGHVVEAPVRYDVHASCTGIDDQLRRPLAKTWFREDSYGEVKVQLVMENGEIGDVKAQGVSYAVARDVRNAVRHLRCGPQTVAAAQVYRFSVDFVDPSTPEGDTQTAGTRRAVIRVSQISR